MKSSENQRDNKPLKEKPDQSERQSMDKSLLEPIEKEREKEKEQEKDKTEDTSDHWDLPDDWVLMEAEEESQSKSEIMHKEKKGKSQFNVAWLGNQVTSLFSRQKTERKTKSEIGTDVFQIQNLPDELTLRIVEFLTPEELLQLGLVNSKMRAFAIDNVLWENEYKYYYPTEYERMKEKYRKNNFPLGFWRTSFFEKHHLHNLMRSDVPKDLNILFRHMMHGNRNAVEKILKNKKIVKQLMSVWQPKAYSKEFSLGSMPFLYYFLSLCHDQTILNIFYEHRRKFTSSFSKNVFREYVWKILCKQKIEETDLIDFYSKKTPGRLSFDEHGFTAPHYAAAAHYTELLVTFHEKQSNLNVPRATSSKFKNFHTPLDLAIANDDTSLVELFLEKFKVKPNSTLSATIALNNHNKEMLTLVLKHMEPKAIYSLLDEILSKATGQLDRSKLMLLVDVLIDRIQDKFADVFNYQQHKNFDETLFAKCCKNYPHIEIVELLLAHGANPNIVFLTRLYEETEYNNEAVFINGSALIIAISRKDKKLIDLLLRYDADPNQRLQVTLPKYSERHSARFFTHPKIITPLEFAERNSPKIYEMMRATIELKKSQMSGPSKG